MHTRMATSKDEIVKTEILNQAQKLFQQFGLKKTTMDEIATASGKAKSTLYHYYKSKEEVFDAVIEKELVGLRKIVKFKVDNSANLKDKMTSYFVSFHEEVLNKLNLYHVVKQELITEAVAKTHFRRLMSFEQNYLTRLLEDAYDSDEYKAIERDEIPWISEIMIAAFFGIVRYSIESEEGFDQEKLTKTAQILVSKIFT